MAQISCGGGISVMGTCLGGSGSGSSGTGVATRVAVWQNATTLTYQNVVIDSDSNLDMNSVSAGHIFMRNETITLGTSGLQNPLTGVDISFINITDDTTCTGTLANGTTIGQTHMIVQSSLGGINAKYDLTVTNFQPASGAAGSYILRFNSAGQSAWLIWDGSNWLGVNNGAIVV